MANPVPLSRRLSNRIDNPIFNNESIEWFMFVLDHVDKLKSESKIVEISLENKNRFQNRFKAFLRFIDLDQRADWIVMLINNITDPNDFISRDYLYIFEENALTLLYRSYKTSETKK